MQLQLSTSDKRILSLAVFMLMTALYFLYDDSLLMSFEGDSDQPVVAQISTLENDVRYKFSKRFAWRSAKSDQKLRLGDSIFTGKGSSAQLRFQDGRSLQVQPNSLVVISSLGDQMNLDLKFGSFGGNLDGCIKVNIKGESVDVCGQNSQVEIKADGDIQVKKGSVQLKDKKIQAQPIEKLVWQDKPESEFYHVQNNKNLNLSWQASKNYERYKIQFSRTEKFKDSPTQDQTNETRFSTKNYPRQGSYFIRIQADDGRGNILAVTDPVKTQFYDVSPPKIKAPLSKEVFKFDTDLAGEVTKDPKIEVSWQYPDSKANFRFELSNNIEFSQIVQTNSLADNKIVTENLPPGTYFVRVQEEKPNRPWSEVVEFEVKYGNDKAISAPQLLTKKIRYKAPEAAPKIEWTPVETADKYLIETSTTADFTPGETKSFQIKSTNSIFEIKKPGTTFFRVSALTKKGGRGPASDVGQLTTLIDRPILNPVEPIYALAKSADEEAPPMDVPVSWTDLKIAPLYEIQLSKTPDFKLKKKSFSKDYQTNIIAPTAGEYFWRVRAVNAQKKPISLFSDAGKINYKHQVPLTQPILTEPQANATLFFQQKATPYVWLEWKPVRQATSYLIQISESPDFSQVIHSSEVKESRYLLQQKLNRGKIYWRTQALGEKGMTSFWSQSRPINIYTESQKSLRLPAGKKRN